MTTNFRLNLLLGIFVGLIIGMNLLGGKIIDFFGVSASVGIFMVPITFLITDIVAEVYGKKAAQQFVNIGVIALVMIFIYTSIFINLSPNARFLANTEYRTIFGASLRIIIASIIAFIISQSHDVWAFHYWKKKTGDRFLWLRNNLSTIVSQAIDTLIFMTIAFYKITPQFDFAFIIKLAIPFYILKVIFALLDTPFAYLGVRWLKNGAD